ncbi:glycoside hydrolase family 3 N-terminal domain-containing protein [Chroococcus sp. FPU101]|uniref:glycoside hydrolase family 3 protein n=1 Tax=Chroococcus sp. FPU101 TaxID=1974212 RepID=UPI001A8DF54A|nr:glycoside hydrolase family 3 N-terminal domain-containing protein [Chroococcus sp. FPU101]GFE70664.1 glycoside hydrolase family 3 domain protein [Chroococcus sp. FPU101]
MLDWTQWSLKEQIGQMIVVRTCGFLFDHQIRYPAWEASNAQLQQWLESLNLGGVILLGGSAVELKERSQQLQAWSQTPLFIAADIEEGVGQRFTGATWFPPPMALGEIAKTNQKEALQYAKQFGAITAQEALAIGINWILAPVVDVNNNSHNPVINIRAFGDTPELVSQLITGFIQGAAPYPILTTAKHFPGHGDTSIDSHLNLPVLEHSPIRLAKIELPPFQAAITAGVDSVMTAHLLIPGWDSIRPATLSPEILTGQLRKKLGFNGLIVTDALIMGGLTNQYTPEEIAVMAVEAGADILLMPSDPAIAIEAVYQAVQHRRISKDRIIESVSRICQLKDKLKPSHHSVSNFFSDLASPNAHDTVAAILNRSMKIGQKLPIIQDEAKKRNLIVVDDVLNCDFLDRHTPAVTIPKQLGYEIQIVDQNTLGCIVEDSRQTLLQVFIRGNPFRGTAGLTETAQHVYQNLLKSQFLQGVIIYGSPYVLEWFESQMINDLPWVFSYGQIPLAQKLACDTMFNLNIDQDKKDKTFTN